MVMTTMEWIGKNDQLVNFVTTEEKNNGNWLHINYFAHFASSG